MTKEPIQLIWDFLNDYPGMAFSFELDPESVELDENKFIVSIRYKNGDSGEITLRGVTPENLASSLCAAIDAARSFIGTPTK